jgi:hypothetical protein
MLYQKGIENGSLFRRMADPESKRLIPEHEWIVACGVGLKSGN